MAIVFPQEKLVLPVLSIGEATRLPEYPAESFISLILRCFFDNQLPSDQKVGLSEVVLILMKWWAQQDLNLRPADYESDALTN